MMQTKEDMECWQREIQKRLDQESKFITELRSFICITGDLEIVESSMMQTKEGMESWQRNTEETRSGVYVYNWTEIFYLYNR